ncbi:hypothetical protein ACGFRB_19560 [Streptomyces sp. NPDC048718]|uniref:hypothetical protein n=1 Tax=Streptomyces sp. NPDC048718 TaxID=3365587 RepID=UPI00372098C3
MIGKRTAVRLGAIASVATLGLGLSTGMASANSDFQVSVTGCSGGMVVTFYNGHDHVQGYVSSTNGDACTANLHQSNGGHSAASTTGGKVWTAELLDAGITSYVTVCNVDRGGCKSTPSY